MTQSTKTDLPDPQPAPQPGPGKDLPNPMPSPKDKKDLPDPFKDDKAGQTATDERGGKAVRGWEDIDDEGHDQGYGDRDEERDGTTGH